MQIMQRSVCLYFPFVAECTSSAILSHQGLNNYYMQIVLHNDPRFWAPHMIFASQLAITWHFRYYVWWCSLPKELCRYLILLCTWSLSYDCGETWAEVMSQCMQAQKLLESIAEQVQPLMRAHKLKVPLLLEFLPKNPCLVRILQIVVSRFLCPCSLPS